MNSILIILGILLILAGMLWPWLRKVPLFHLPGDIVIKREHFRFYLPIATAVLLSVLLSLALWIWRKISG